MPQHLPALIMSLTPPCGYTEDALASKSQDVTPFTSTTYLTFVKRCYSSTTAWWATPCCSKPGERPWAPRRAQHFATTYNVKHCNTKQFTLSGFFATRYVDNRLTLLPTCATHLSHFSQFLSPHFYGAPILLETEPGLDFLGFTIKPSQHAIHYKATSNLTGILSPQSASPDIVLRSSFRARAILAQRLATPQEAVAHRHGAAL